jgi:ABC-2 type transport system permease protein
MSGGWTYTRYELLRTLRNRRYFIFSLIFPVVLFFAIAAPNRNAGNLSGTGISTPLYFMVGLVGFGGMSSMMNSGGRIAAERTAGWNRQLRVTPLRPFTYFRSKVVTAYLTTGVTMAVLYTSGVALGVSLPADQWLEMTALILVGLIPFAAFGIFMGHLLTADSVGPVLGGSISLFALLGGTWFPIGDGVMHDIAEILPSYWLVQASHVSLGGPGWGVTGWLVVGAWTVVLTIAAAAAYRRDTGRV